MIPIIDFHCDLLVYLEGGNLRTAFDHEVRCAIPQLRAGGVKAQICAIFVETGKGSSQRGERQAGIFARLPQKYYGDFECATPQWWEQFEERETIGLIPAFESASGFCDEEESLDEGFRRLARIDETIGNLAYISLTWNLENRFGGPPGSSIGLKRDGKELLAFMDGRNIAVDLSHASDALAHDILTTIDVKGLDIPVVASHSNCRAVADYPRNLPDELIQEIIHRNGVIGLNFVREFVGSFEEQIAHFHKLGAEGALVFGADFFYGEEANSLLRKPAEGWYFPDYQDASCYPKLMQQLGLDETIAYRNAKRFLKNIMVEKVL